MFRGETLHLSLSCLTRLGLSKKHHDRHLTLCTWAADHQIRHKTPSALGMGHLVTAFVFLQVLVKACKSEHAH